MKRDFFQGRYGFDPLSGFLLMVAVILLMWKYTWIPAIALIGLALFRVLSRNTENRKREFWAFELIMRKTAWFFRNNPVAGGVSLARVKWKQRKTYKIMKCPKCKKNLRVPRHKGKISVTCPMCGHEFITKT